ncbi:putative G-type lectin S-receptor-like serine/threonine-protein kinase [Camellia lanceoleosa]|uniref:G-type lectin S-receptor-like serine/threonine-protein kinase n=2 Tax=Camellia lanceoleosa TaxID=1840588 RepID=A0ACC0GN41_9ERIC|nr:putative G-type lectin S-receptor-like serine/threonine-protein kinase [Camellia lanceoleosa]
MDVWEVLQSHPANKCEEYNQRGSFRKCSMIVSVVPCNCIDGFGPKDSDQWRKGDWFGGCSRKEALECGRNDSGDGFLAVEGVNLPDFASTVAAENIEECEGKCLTNCSCNAFAFVVGIRCMMWSGDLVDVEEFTEGGNTLYVRLAKSELGMSSILL